MLQTNHVLNRAVVALDLTLRLRLVGCAARMVDNGSLRFRSQNPKIPTKGCMLSRRLMRAISSGGMT